MSSYKFNSQHRFNMVIQMLKTCKWLMNLRSRLIKDEIVKALQQHSSKLDTFF